MAFSTKEIHEWLSVKPRHTTGIRILQVIIGSMICFRIGTEIPFAAYLWGPDGISTTETSQHYFGETLGSFFDNLFFSSMSGVYALLFLLFVGATSLIFNIKTRVASALCAFTFILLESRLPAINDGGDNIMRLTLIYMILLTSKPLKENLSKIKIWVHNIGVASIILQLMILYETSGFLKANGEKWQNGTAMYVISNVEWFSLPGFRTLFSNPYITTIGTYVPMFFMILFPVAIFSRFKFLWIFIGVMLHFGIAYAMGLIVFSSVMIGLELSLINDSEYERFGLFIRNSWIVKKLYPRLTPVLELVRIKNSKQ
jgi:hypothetical protein